MLVQASTRREGRKSDANTCLSKIYYLDLLCSSHISTFFPLNFGLRILDAQNGTWHSQDRELAQFWHVRGGGQKQRGGIMRDALVLQSPLRSYKNFQSIWGSWSFKGLFEYMNADCWSGNFWSWPSFSPCIWFSTLFLYLHWNVGVTNTLTLYDLLAWLDKCCTSSNGTKNMKSPALDEGILRDTPQSQIVWFF